MGIQLVEVVIMAKPKKINLRLLVQIFFFTLIALISVNKTLAAASMGIPFLSAASLHALCPFGGVETFFTLVTTGLFVPKTQISAVILMSLVFLLALLFGPVFCGWVCPFGAFQEWLGKIGKRLFKKRYNHFIPPKVDRVLRYLRYGVLVWVLTVFIGGIFGSMVLGLWNTQTNNQDSGGKNKGDGQKNQVQIEEEVSD